MGLLVPTKPGFGYVTGNVLTTRPATGLGTTITPAQNSFGSYTSILAGGSIARDCYGILININSLNSGGFNRDALLTIGIDTAGGTTYVDLIPNLLCSCAGTYLVGGHWYYFPIFIKSGSQLAAKGSVNNASFGTMRVAVWLYGAPSNMEGLQFGQGVESIGAVTASSCGTTVTAGGASEGSWTSLGTTVRKCVAWQHGMGCNDATMTNGLCYSTDISFGDGTNQIILGQDRFYYIRSTSEDLSGALYPPFPCEVPAGATIYGRMQCSGTPDAGLSMIAYGVY
jgi:hypothetical protein